MSNFLQSVHRLQRVLSILVRKAVLCLSGLVMAVGFLLFLQWPLRDWLHAYAREANDLAQWLFALYISAAVTYATQAGAHPGTQVVAGRYPAWLRQYLRRAASLFVLLPWSLFILHAAWPAVWQSVVQLEAFPETYNPGYFIVKVAAWLLALLVALQAVADILPRAAEDGGA